MKNSKEIRAIVLEAMGITLDNEHLKDLLEYKKDDIDIAVRKLSALFSSDPKLSEDMTAAYMAGFEKGKDSVLARMEVGEIDSLIRVSDYAYHINDDEFQDVIEDRKELSIAIVKYLRG